MNATKLYPGMLDDSVEFFNFNNQPKVITNGLVINFADAPARVHQLAKQVYDRHPEADEVLRNWFPTQPGKRLEAFVKCRFGGLDFTPDIQNGTIQDGEYWDCPMRGNCKGEGIVCKPISYNNQTLTSTEIKILRLLVTDKINTVISDDLNLPLGTFHKLKQILYQKLNIRTRPEATVVVMALNLL